MGTRELHELEPVAEWRAADVADPEEWTLRLDADDQAELDAALARAKRKSTDPLELGRDDFPLDGLAAKLDGVVDVLLNGRGFARIATLDAGALRRRRPHPPLLGHRAASGRAVGPEPARPRARRRHGPGQDRRRPDRARQRARRHRARLPHRRIGPGRAALPAPGARGRALVRGQRGGHPQPPRAREPRAGRRAVRAAALRHAGRAGRGAQAFYSDARVHGARRAALRALHPAVHPRLAAPSRRAPPRQTAREAIAAASALANDPDFNVYMDLQPGEMQFINNYHVLHGRTAYEDDVAHGYKRHLKRLWLATYALDRPPGAFAALGAQPLGGEALGQPLPAVERVDAGSASPGRCPGEEPTPPRAHGHGGVDEVAGQRTLAQDADRRHRGVDDGRRSPVADAAVDDAGDVGGGEGVRHLARLGQAQRDRPPRPVLPAELAQRTPLGHAHRHGPGMGVLVGRRRPPTPAASGRNTSTGPGPTALEQPVQLVGPGGGQRRGRRPGRPTA